MTVAGRCTRAPNLHVFDHHVANAERLLPEAHFQQLHLTHASVTAEAWRRRNRCRERGRRYHLLEFIFNIERGLLQKSPREKGAVLGRKDVCVPRCYEAKCDACRVTQIRKLTSLSFRIWRSMNAAAAAAASQQKRLWRRVRRILAAAATSKLPQTCVSEDGYTVMMRLMMGSVGV